MEETKVTTGGGVNPTAGSVGLETQLPGQATTITGEAEATGGIGAGNQIEVDIDEELFKFEGAENTPLMQLMLKARSRTVKSPEIQHALIDEERSTLTTASAVTADTTKESFSLPLVSEDKKIPRQCMTLRVKGVSGYDENGVATPGVDLMLYVLGQDNDGYPKCMAVNGPRASKADMPTVPSIPAGSTIITMSNMLYETQAVVPPDSFTPQLMDQYLQKRGMTSIVSDYYEHQKKKIPFGKAAQAEQAIKNFLLRGNRTLWGSVLGKIVIETPIGNQYAWSTKGVRWQFVREMQHSGSWTYETLIGLAKMFYTGEDKPSNGILLCGKDLLESLQLIDYKNHPEVTMKPMKNETMGWVVSNIHTAFGDFQVKHDPTLDNSGWSHSGALIGEGRLVHYKYTSEHKVNDRVEGEEASRTSNIVWDALCLKGTCHIWIDGEGATANGGATVFQFWESTDAPAANTVTDGVTYYFTVPTSLGNGLQAERGSLWTAKVSGNTLTWEPYKGTMLLG